LSYGEKRMTQEEREKSLLVACPICGRTYYLVHREDPIIHHRLIRKRTKGKPEKAKAKKPYVIEVE